MRSATRQNSHLTHKANVGVGRHGWLRLTPAYSVRLVREHVEGLPANSVVTDPFSGTGTTPLAAAEFGHLGQSLDINPFLIWLGSTKTAGYSRAELDATQAALRSVEKRVGELLPEADGLWQPKLHNIERWWPQSELDALKCIRKAVDEVEVPEAGKRILGVALCRTLIAASNAAFNHQSMSFKDSDDAPRLFDLSEAQLTLQAFVREAEEVIGSARVDLPGSARVLLGDSRSMQPASAELEPCDLLLTSPPYVNRMSYIRELRPYMYWLRYLDLASDAGDLDWQAIGGTWGTATSKVAAWQKPDVAIPVAEELLGVQSGIEQDGGKNGPLLSNYVAKYFFDMWDHFQAAFKNIKSGGRAVYIIGNSSFYGHVVPAEEWYAALMRETGFTDVDVTVIRKRNSNKALFEYAVSGVRP